MRTRCAARASLTIWRDGIVNPKTGAAIGTGAFLTGSMETWQGIVLRRNPRYWGPHPAFVRRCRSPLRASMEARSATDSAAATSTSLHGFSALSFYPELVGAKKGHRTLAIAGTGMEHFAFRIGAGGHPALRSEARSSGTRFRGGPRALARAAPRGPVYPEAPQRDSIVFPTPSRYYRANWGMIQLPPRRGAAGCLSSPAVGAAPMASTAARAATSFALRRPR